MLHDFSQRSIVYSANYQLKKFASLQLDSGFVEDSSLWINMHPVCCV